jgi:peptidoglycan hydrolase-like protein with peptidoglycan-binding domain
VEDLVLRHDLKKDNSGKKVGLVQEWLCLHGIGLKVDQDFGPATDFAVRLFQKRRGLSETGVVEATTFEELVKPMKNALAPIPGNERPLGRIMVSYARQHLREHPREIGGQNKGPWVRLYMKGNEGKQWPWCAGFVSFLLGQASTSLGVDPPFQSTFSCSIIAGSARRAGIFLEGTRSMDRSLVTPGAVFLVRGGGTGWAHTGIVAQVKEEVFLSIEGNTNDEGSHEGYEVSSRIRSYDGKDFVLVDEAR